MSTCSHCVWIDLTISCRKKTTLDQTLTAVLDRWTGGEDGGETGVGGGAGIRGTGGGGAEEEVDP
jgi:hypothetical protein